MPVQHLVQERTSRATGTADIDEQLVHGTQSTPSRNLGDRIHLPGIWLALWHAAAWENCWPGTATAAW
ncbi:MAG: hypothetical protein ACC645_22095, partial [Pirellulales bacterium]